MMVIKCHRQFKKQVLVETDALEKYYPATYWVKEILLKRLTEEKTEQFKVLAGMYKITPQKKKERSSFVNRLIKQKHN